MKARLLACAAALLMCSSVATYAQDAWKITTMLPLTGPFAPVSHEMKVGFEMALEEINAKGGVAGKKMTLDIMDTQSNPGQVASLIRQACSDALIVAGPTLSNEARVAFPVAKSLECPSIASSAAATGLTVNTLPWTYTYSTPAHILAPAAMQVLIKKLSPKKAVVVLEKADPSATDQGTLAEKTLTAAGVATETLNVDSNDVDFGPAVTRLSASEPDLVVLATLGKSAVGMLKELKKAQTKASILITQSALSQLVNSLDAETLEGVYRYAEFDPMSSTDPRVMEFVKIYQGRNDGKSPTFIATSTYDTLFLVRDMIEAAGLSGDPAKQAEDRKKFVEKLGALKDWKGLVATMSMSPEGFMIKPATVLVSKAGKLERVSAE